MSDGTMEEGTLPSVTQSSATAHGKTVDSNAAQRQNGQTQGNCGPVRLLMSTSSICCHLILIAFTVYIVVICCQNTYSLFLWHPALCTIGGFFLMAEAIMAMSTDDPLARKFRRPTRVKIHWILQVLGALCMFAGFLIVIINKNLNHFSHFKSWHAILGLIAMIMVVLTSTGGLGALYSIKFKQYVRPAVIKLIHDCAGIITFIITVISLILSLYTRWMGFQKNYSDTVKIICVILICVSTVFILQRATRSAFSMTVRSFQRK